MGERKQVIIINNKLKLSKGKLARVAGFLTAQVIFEQKASYQQIWKCIVLKTDDYERVMEYLNNIGQDFVCHIDAGFTQVKYGTNCGLSFIYPDGVKYPLIDELKLL